MYSWHFQLTTLATGVHCLGGSPGSVIDWHVVLGQIPVVIDIQNRIVAIRAIVKHQN